MKYCEIDLHSNNSVVSVLDEEDHVVVEKRLPNDLAKIIGLIKPWQEELAGIVVESTFNWYWLVDGLKEAGFTVHLANTTAIKRPAQYTLRETKNEQLAALPRSRQANAIGQRRKGHSTC